MWRSAGEVEMSCLKVKVKMYDPISDGHEFSSHLSDHTQPNADAHAHPNTCSPWLPFPTNVPFQMMREWMSRSHICHTDFKMFPTDLWMPFCMRLCHSTDAVWPRAVIGSTWRDARCVKEWVEVIHADVCILLAIMEIDGELSSCVEIF